MPLHRSSLLVAFLVTACGSSQPEPRAPASPSAAGQGCPVSLQGPVIGITEVAGTDPTPAGGAIVDGDYELVQVVDFVSGRPLRAQPPTVRGAMRFVTQERGPNFAKGSMALAFEYPPSVQCGEQLFAVVGTELRMAKDGKSSSVPYSMSPNGDFVMHSPEKVHYVFRRRR